jgi:hypothetical protein
MKHKIAPDKSTECGKICMILEKVLGETKSKQMLHDATFGAAHTSFENFKISRRIMLKQVGVGNPDKVDFQKLGFVRPWSE